MKIATRWIPVSAVVSLAVLLSITLGLPVVQGSADHVRWDIINFAAGTPPTISAGGFAIAAARNPSTLTIKLTGSGTFIGPSSGGTSSGVKGGGTWQTFSGTTSTGSGTYEVRELISWQFANLQATGNIDLIDHGPAANGNAVLRIAYSDGSEGVLGVGCHGPGAPPGIVEGVIASKDFVTYWDAQAPAGVVNANRTVFHLR
jgi:hypothetical protein